MSPPPFAGAVRDHRKYPSTLSGTVYRLILPLLPLLLTAVLSSPALAADWKESYTKGEEALNKQDWTSAEQLFTDAIRLNPESSIKGIRDGMFFKPYFPHLKLGIALFNMGRFEEALKAFETEESMGAVSRSKVDLENLTSLRDLAKEQAQIARTTSAVSRQAAIVKSGLQQASSLEARGDLDGALKALGPALSVDRDNEELQAELARIQRAIGRRDADRQRADEVEGLMKQAHSLADRKAWSEASVALRATLVLDPNNEDAKRLLAVTVKRQQEQLAAEKDARRTKEEVRTAIARARDLDSRGDAAGALDLLQPVLAADPNNADARALEQRLEKTMSERKAEDSRRKQIEGLLSRGSDEMKSGDLRSAVATFNRIMTLDPGNKAASDHLETALSLMSHELRPASASPPATKLPPVIALANENDALAESGSLEGESLPEETVSSKRFTISGLVLDDQEGVRIWVEKMPDGAVPPDSPAGPPLRSRAVKSGNMYTYHFSRTFDLTAPVSILRVVASDRDQLRAEADHRVRYIPPFWSGTRTLVTAGLLLVAAISVVEASRFRKRRRLLTRRHNPYIAGAPVLDADLFVGREKLLCRILQSIHNNSILLYGERRIGKTSLQHHLKRRLVQLEDPEYEFHPVYIDLQGTPQERFFETLTKDILGEFAPVLGNEFEARVSAGGTGDPYDALLRVVRNVLRELGKRSARKAKLVLLIDEVDELNEYDPRINQKLRSLFMKSFAENLVAVVSGVEILRRWESAGSPWYNFFEEIEVKPLTRDDAAELIERPIRHLFTLEAGVVERIIENTDCKPYKIQKVCISLVNRLYEHGRRKITVADVDAIGRPLET